MGALTTARAEFWSCRHWFMCDL